MKFYISILIISLIICSPPPKPEPTYEVFVQTSKPVQNINNTSLKDLEEASPSLYVEETTVVVNILENGKYEEHELKIATKNYQITPILQVILFPSVFQMDIHLN